MATQYKGDPFWMVARFQSKCPNCGGVIKRGDEIFYYPRARKAICADPCGRQQSAEFAAAAQDEDVYMAQ